ncbi:unnamed protein product [Dovyalis caffra]|uniref:Uncharacterized protein n=1 Tax=Dovyalis caffra TaxID=77055 RepID=A0AAV1RLC7_9ROSI|nr:unnamed protein product [Dovyalis caffra]
MDCGVSFSQSPNSSMNKERDKVSMPSSSKESPAKGDNPTDSRFDSNQSSTVPPVVNMKDFSVSVDETLNSAVSNETNSVSIPSSSEESPVIAGNPIAKISLDSDQTPIVLPVKSSQDFGVSVNETSNSATSDERDEVSFLSFSQESPADADKPVKSSLDSDQSSMELLVTDSQDNSVSINETLNSVSSHEMEKVSMPFPSKGSPVNSDNPIDENSLESEQSSLAPPSTNSQDISVSVNETLNSPSRNGTGKVSMPSSCTESIVIADHQIVENSLDSDQSSIVLHETNSQHIDASFSETLNSVSSNKMDKASMPSSSKIIPVGTDNPMDENSLDSARSSLAPPSTNSQDISVSVNETLNSSARQSSSEEILVIADDQLVENSLDSVQSSIVLPETNYHDIDVSVSETLNSSSNETDKVYNPSYSKESLSVADNPDAKNSLDSDQSSTASAMTKSQDIVSKDNFYDCQDWIGSESDDDFFSAKGDYSGAWSRQSSIKGETPTEGREKLVEPFHDGFSSKSYQVDDHKSMPPTTQGIKLGNSEQEPSPVDENKKLAELLREPFWSGHANDHDSIAPISNETKLVELLQDSQWSQEIASTRVAACHLSPTDGNSTNTGRANCCFPSWSPSRGSKERKKQTPPRSQG